MNELVFLEPNKIDAIPYTTSDVIAKWADIKNRSVYLLIEKHIKELEQFGRVSFEMTPFETKGGLQERKIYHLNEQQATLLVTFLKNTPTVVEFKTELVRQFYNMRTELLKRRVYREELKPIRRELTDVIQNLPKQDKWIYKRYTDLAYKSSIGKNASQLRKERNAKPKAAAIDYMNADEIRRVSKVEYQIAVLLDIGMTYDEVKNLINAKTVLLPMQKK